MNTQENPDDFAGRALIAAIRLYFGLQKIGGHEATQGYMAAMGVPGAWSLDARRTFHTSPGRSL